MSAPPPTSAVSGHVGGVADKVVAVERKSQQPDRPRPARAIARFAARRPLIYSLLFGVFIAAFVYASVQEQPRPLPEASDGKWEPLVVGALVFALNYWLWREGGFLQRRQDRWDAGEG